MKEKKNAKKQLLRQIKQLPEELRQAIYWLIENIDLIDKWPYTPMTLEEKKQYVEKSLSRGDYFLAVVLEYKWFEQERDKDFRETLYKGLGEFITDRNGEILLSGLECDLEAGTVLLVKEVSTLDGYLLDAQEKEILLEADKAASVQFENQPLNPILIKKVDQDGSR